MNQIIFDKLTQIIGALLQQKDNQLNEIEGHTLEAQSIIKMDLPLYYESSFNIYQSHIEGSQVEITANNQGQLFSIGTDDVLNQYNMNSTQPKVYMVENPHAFKVAKITMKPEDNNVVIIGTHDGNVSQYLLPTGNNLISPTLTHSHTLYRTITANTHSALSHGIRSLQFTKDGRFLIIVSNQLSCIIYDYQNKRFFKHKLQQQTQFLTVVTDYANKFLCLIDAQGKAHIFQIQIKQQTEKMEIQEEEDSQDPFAQQQTMKEQFTLKLLLSYKITNPQSNILKNNKYNIIASFNCDTSSFMAQNLYLPGQKTLQKLQLSLPPAQFTHQYNLCTRIVHSTEIIQAIWLKNQKAGLILTGTQSQAIIWHQKKEQKVMIFSWTNILSQSMRVNNVSVRIFSDLLQNWGFSFVTEPKNPQETIESIKVYDFKAFPELQKQLIKYQMNQMSINQEQPQQENQIQIELMQQSNKFKPKINKKQPQQSIAAKLLTVYLQPSLTPGYQKYTGDNARFLFYNNIGCIIERQLAERQSFIELQFHNRSKISRIKISSDSLLQHFALCSDTLVTASLNTLNVRCQKQLKEGYQWDCEWQGIEGVAIGGQWICAVNKGQIRVWDWVGNELHNIAFDRKFMGVAAYQDLLVLVYHSSLPMWGAQSYKMLIYQVTPYTIKCIRNTNVPSKPTVALKWFGFSQEGMLFCQDQSQILRCYMFEKDEWAQLMTIDPTIERIFIQHIENYQLYGFRLEQKFPNEPRVIPRSLPRKIPFQLTSFNASFLTPQQTQYIKRHKLSILWLQHEKYRHNKWYKLKYSLNKQNRWFDRMNTIKSEDEIREQQGRLDLKLMEYVQKYIKIHKNDSVLQKKNWKALMMLCTQLAFYEETKNRLAESLLQSDIQSKPDRDVLMFTCQQQSNQFLPMKKSNLSQLERLEEMMGLTWFDKMNIGRENILDQ